MEEIINGVERVVELEATREATLEDELPETFTDVEFPQTREVIAEEREALDHLRTLLQEESAEIESLEEATEHLTVDQATRNRDAALEGLATHHEHLREFESAMRAALELIESNLDTVTAGGIPDSDPEPFLSEAREAIDAHNDAVDGLGKNLRILNAYLI